MFLVSVWSPVFPNLGYCSSTVATLKLCAETQHLHWASGSELLLLGAKKRLARLDLSRLLSAPGYLALSG